MDKSESMVSAVDLVFDERKKFIILGLTGRTGSGCTTTASLLSKSFQELSPPKPKTVDFDNDESRKYKIAYNYLGDNWGQFYHIQLRDLITTFILDEGFEKFCNFCCGILEKEAGDFSSAVGQDYIQEFEALHVQRVKIKNDVNMSQNALSDESMYSFYFEKIPAFTLKTKDVVDAVFNSGYTKVYQLAANNIRSSGDAYKKKFNPSHIYKLSQRANKLIKLLRKRSIESSHRVLVCLDAIRNPFEVSFFRERYSAFYLVSVSTDENSRKERLRSAYDFSDKQIDNIDLKENPKKLKGKEYFCSQDIPKCIQSADIHIFNPSDNRAYKELKKQLVKYVALIMHPGLITPHRSERCMQVAYNAKLNSGCISRQVGAVAADKNYAIKAVGWNDVAKGQTPCNLRSASDLIEDEDEDAYTKYEKEDGEFKGVLTRVYTPAIVETGCSGKPLCFCFKDIQNSIDGEKNQVHTRALHAEENAFLQISKYGGQGLENGVLFTTASPCELCSKKAYQLGIKKIYFVDPYPGIAKDQILIAGQNQPELRLFTGAVGRAYQQLFEPVMPYKEELELSTGIKIPNVKSELRSKITKLEHSNRELEKKLNEYKERIKDFEEGKVD